MIRALQMRAMLVFVVFACGFTLISSKLVYLQLIKSDYYREWAVRLHYKVVPLEAERGRILDVNGKILAQTVSVTDMYIDGKLAYEDPQEVEEIAGVMGWPLAQLQAQITPSNRYIPVAKDIMPDVVERLKVLKTESRIRSLILENRHKRVYPNGQEASHIIGFTNNREEKFGDAGLSVNVERGMQGVEQVMDRVLAGTAGERRMVKDLRNIEIAAYRQMDRSARDGLDVVLTVNQSVQHEIEVEADRLYNEFSANGVHIVVVKVETGEIMGMTSRPTYDPNDRSTYKPANLRNRAIMDQYEPGSTFKIVTLAAALNERLVQEQTPLYCENGTFFYAGHKLTDTSEHGMLPVWEAFAVSSNIGFAKIGLLLGEDRLYKYIRQLGFGDPVQNSSLAIKGEQSGLLRSPDRWAKVDLTRIPIGYGIAVTNLQMAMAVSAIANDGKLMEPRIVRSVVDKEGRVVQEFLPRAIRQVVSHETSLEVAEVMGHVVQDEHGTGKAAQVKGHNVAGKTGTAWKIVDGRYPKGVYYSSFIGFVPQEDPQFLVSIVVDEPKGKKYYGGSVAAPAFSRIATQVAQEMGLTSSESSSVVADRRVHP